MTTINRRQAVTVLGLGALTACSKGVAAESKKRRFTMDLCPGRIGVNSGQLQTIELATEYGFESVEPVGWFLADQSKTELKTLKSMLGEHHLAWGAAGLSVDFRKDEATFAKELGELPKIAKGLSAAGVQRVGTWIMPCHDTLTYRENFDQHATRLRSVAKILKDFGLRLGLEYVGPRTLWSSKRYPFLHSMNETKELISAIGTGNVGFVLDSWHWYTAEETLADLQSITAEQIVAVDLNDAPKGLHVRDQIDNKRELPAATGVIDIQTFLQALVDLDYDGPVRAEPFNQPLNKMDNEPAVEATANAIRKAIAMIN